MTNNGRTTHTLTIIGHGQIWDALKVHDLKEACLQFDHYLDAMKKKGDKIDPASLREFWDALMKKYEVNVRGDHL